MKHIILLWIIVLLGTGVRAQVPVFDQVSVPANAVFGGVVAGAGSNIYGSRSAPDAQGNTYEAGTFYGSSAAFGPFSIAAPTQTFVAFRNAAGVYQWAVGASSNGTMRVNAFSADANGGVVIAGSFDGSTATFGPFTLTNSYVGIPNAYQRPDIFVAKLSATGTWLWAVRAGGATQTGAFDLVTDLLLDSAGNAYVSGTFDGPTAQFGSTVLTNAPQVRNDLTDVFVAKLNAAGAWQWAVQGGGPGNDEAPYLAFTAGGDLLVTGHLYNFTATFGTVTITNPTGGAFVAKLSPAGVWQWATSSSGNDPCGGTRIAQRALVDGQGNIYVMGSFSSTTATFGTTTLTNTPGPRISTSCAAPSDMFVAKLNASGAWQWAVRGGGSGSDSNQAVAIDAAGNAYLTGYFADSPASFGNTTLNNGSAMYSINNGPGTSYFKYNDVYVAKVNAAGVFEWAISAGGNTSDYGTGITMDAAGCLTVTGYFNSPTLRFGSLTLNNPAGTGGGYSPFSAHLSCQPLSAATAREAGAFALYPNPSRTGDATLTWQSAPGHQAARLLVYSALGQLVLEKGLAPSAAGTAHVTGLAAGVYLARLVDSTGGELGAAQRLVVQP
ncbi:T9SS type A sorting domain-containing protein [Hymenobacter properus]|uniref:T9SS type A sorting domain-containing protein n=1 Tax=Hymenobacter properus TaxID=2791026 RepID=A0A931BCV4_9BACT|nr:T9SS type A sorting domain-containing protein [Hymenobacter properus]MBF9141515.1 T9SS type A sorting domain-containing protein [Hymenobacter properus]MBR7720324.1 T9SS type A sorting domain-containing protein [Microvirga sp. SRT04]